MKEYLKVSLVIFIIALSSIYLLGSFIQWEPKISNWEMNKKVETNINLYINRYNERLPSTKEIDPKNLEELKYVVVSDYREMRMMIVVIFLLSLVIAGFIIPSGKETEQK